MAENEYVDPLDEPTYYRHTRIQWPDPEIGPWKATVHWYEIEGRLECVGLNIWHGMTPETASTLPDREPAPITATNLRELGVQGLLEAARHKFLAERQELLEGAGALARWATPDVRRGMTVARTRQIKRARPGRKLGRPVYDEAHWEAVRDTYLEHFRDGSPSPTADVSVDFGVEYSTAAKWISRLRNEFGLLPKTTQGKARAKEEES